MKADQSIFESLKSDFDGFTALQHTQTHTRTQLDLAHSYLLIGSTLNETRRTITKTLHGCVDERANERINE